MVDTHAHQSEKNDIRCKERLPEPSPTTPVEAWREASLWQYLETVHQCHQGYQKRMFEGLHDWTGTEQHVGWSLLLPKDDPDWSYECGDHGREPQTCTDFNLLLIVQLSRTTAPCSSVPFCCFQGLRSPCHLHMLGAGCWEVPPAVSLMNTLMHPDNPQYNSSYLAGCRRPTPNRRYRTVRPDKLGARPAKDEEWESSRTLQH